jgi:hypothetical protein
LFYEACFIKQYAIMYFYVEKFKLFVSAMLYNSLQLLQILHKDIEKIITFFFCNSLQYSMYITNLTLLWLARRTLNVVLTLQISKPNVAS